MQIWIATNNRDVPRVMKTSCLLISSKSAWKSTPKCTWTCWRVWWSLVQSGGRCHSLGVATGLSTSPQVQRDSGLASEGVLRLYTLLSLAPLLPRPEPDGLLRLVIRQEHHQHNLPQHQSQPDHRHPPSSHWCLWKRHAPSSVSVSRRGLRLKAATLNRC